MKKLLLLAFLFPLLSFGQTPFGYHATWHFRYGSWSEGSGYKKIQHVSDTNMLGFNWLKFEVTGIKEVKWGPDPGDTTLEVNVTFDPIFFATRNDSIFRLLNDSTPYLLYDFNAEVGDSWQFAPHDTSFGCDSLPIATVVNKGVEIYNGDTVTFIEIENAKDTSGNPSAPYQMPEKIYREFGPDSTIVLFYPIATPCNMIYDYFSSQTLRCFSNDNISINFTSNTCDYWPSLSVDAFQLVDVKISPNPTFDYISIDVNPQEVDRIEVLSLEGRKLLETDQAQKIKLPEASGVYLVEVYFTDGRRGVSKVLKR